MSQQVCYICCDNCRLVSNGHILLLHKCLYISLFSFLKKAQAHSLVSFSQQKKFFFFSYKKLIFESKSIGVHKVRGSFRCTRSEPTGCCILGEERNQNLLPVQWGRFLTKDSVYALQPKLFNSFP